ncbi:glycosyltransferase family 4 protein [Castellaniella sp.]|uniref:glycosyltransferase family 4 protein n=1 Tax=Castellaniella sp. TaxID=1955812 RepID=UPI003C765140
MAIRVLLLTQWFDPEPTFKGLAFARELVRQGFDVEVVTGFPNYPGGKLYTGYRIKYLQRDIIEGVQVARVPLYPSHDQSSVKRVANYVSFAISSLFYCLFFAKRADVIYAYHPPLTVGVVASLVRTLRRIPVVYDIQDMWPDTLSATDMLKGSRVLAGVAAVCSWVYRHVDHIVVLSPGFKRLLVSRGVPEGKLQVVYNWADEAALAEPKHGCPAALTTDDRRFTVLFAGNMGKAQALDAVLDAAQLLQRRGVAVRWVMLGGGVDVSRLRQRAHDLSLSSVVFLPFVPMAEVGAYLNAADVLLVHLRKEPLFSVTIPSKTQAYMAMGKPLLMAVDGDAADLVHQSGGGVVVAPENPQALADAVEQMTSLSSDELHAMGQRAKEYYQQHLAIAVGVRHFGEIFKRLSGVHK